MLLQMKNMKHLNCSNKNRTGVHLFFISRFVYLHYLKLNQHQFLFKGVTIIFNDFSTIAAVSLLITYISWMIRLAYFQLSFFFQNEITL